MAIEPDQARRVMAQADCLFSEEQVMQALDRMADDISDRLANSNPLVLCVMTGGVVPTGHLLTRLKFPLQLDYIHATRYTGKTRGGDLVWIARPQHTLKGRSVLIVDDILDEGVTLKAIVEECFNEGASEVLTAVLTEKLHDRKAGIDADFVGLQVEDRYVFGYGMDYKDYYRNAAGIYADNS